MKIIGWVCFVSFILLMGINSLFMVTSPTAWFRLPLWLRATGSLKPEKYTRGFGAVQVRIVGAAILLFIG
jgi:hypothetical protein